MNKALTRVEEITSNEFPPALACRPFNAHGLSVFGYVSQLTPPPPILEMSELRMANKTMQLVTNSFDARSALQLHVLGGPKLPRSLAYMFACITRASLDTFSELEAQRNSLFPSALENECLADSVGRNAIPNGWGSLAFCSDLLAASAGDLANRFFRGTKSIIVATQ